jgi:hypothetical protein
MSVGRFERLFRSEADAVRAFPRHLTPDLPQSDCQRSLSAVEADGNRTPWELSPHTVLKATASSPLLGPVGLV